MQFHTNYEKLHSFEHSENFLRILDIFLTGIITCLENMINENLANIKLKLTVLGLTRLPFSSAKSSANFFPAGWKLADGK